MAGDPSDPLVWLARAKSNLRRVELGRQDELILYEDLCFDAQQSAEKALKALCIHRGIEFEKVHSIAYLLGLLREDGVQPPPVVMDADGLTTYAVVTRYPGHDEVVDGEAWESAVAVARQTLAWVERMVAETPPAAAGDEGP